MVTACHSYVTASLSAPQMLTPLRQLSLRSFRLSPYSRPTTYPLVIALTHAYPHLRSSSSRIPGKMQSTSSSRLFLLRLAPRFRSRQALAFRLSRRDQRISPFSRVPQYAAESDGARKNRLELRGYAGSRFVTRIDVALVAFLRFVSRSTVNALSSSL
ncbi:hypothetical protein AAT19DRAFT_9045 [Rhodotorula toruloides]|uniref:Uncharacterized protein n=1 Tax=Rhodotorula toruloides TaxID=5286 RepID=A0A2T0AIX8_RHOTO|nr:hypothetical protein AAT19DRAFT_9045 [Rhodotorula toruloides]